MALRILNTTITLQSLFGIIFCFQPSESFFINQEVNYHTFLFCFRLNKSLNIVIYVNELLHADQPDMSTFKVMLNMFKVHQYTSR